MSTSVIQVQGLGKRFRIGKLQKHATLGETIASAFQVPFRRKAQDAPSNGNGDAEILWALRNINFEVHPGEVVGLIGRNGAGKSTLLKILARITRPTEGWAEVRGRVGSLLEVGTGFHPQLTGRENVFLSGAILGMRKAEIACKFDEIVAFSEVERFLDTQLKHYSSGMQMRLAFAVAAHLEPEILFIDEVLAVGDAEFQKKCVGKMGDVARQGRTILFVSHNTIAMQSLCGRAIWLKEGSLVQDGPASTVISVYLSQTPKSSNANFWPDPTTAPGNDKVRIRKVNARREPSATRESELITVRTPVRVEFEYWNLKANARLNLSVLVHSKNGVLAFATATGTERVWHGKAFPEGLYRSICYVPGNLLNDGTHRLSLLIVENETNVIYQHNDLITFEVQEDGTMRKSWYGDWPGATRPMLQWTTEFVSPVVGEPCAEIYP